MGSIKDIISLSPDVNRLAKNQDVKKVKTDKQDDKVKSASDKETQQDKLQISDAARELLSLRMEAADYMDEVKSAQTLSDQEVEKIKDKIENKYFTEPEVIDTIVDKLLALPNYINKTSGS